MSKQYKRKLFEVLQETTIIQTTVFPIWAKSEAHAITLATDGELENPEHQSSPPYILEEEIAGCEFKCYEVDNESE